MRLWSSTFLLTMALLIAADVVVATAGPKLRPTDETRNLSPAAKVSKLLRAPDNKDVLLLGSSLVLVSSVRVDDELNGRKTRFDAPYYRYKINHHCQANYLEKLLSERTGRPVEICNAAVAASVVSDELLITRKYLATGKSPKMAVVCVAPREFLDNDRAPYTKTPTYTAVSDVQPEPKRAAELALKSVWHLYGERSEYNDRLQTLAEATTGHPLSKEDAEWQPAYQQPPNMLYDIPGYKKMYLPINKEQWKVQSKSFHDLLAMLKERGIPTVVVDMPVTKEYYALLPAKVLDDYRNLIASETAQFGVPLLKPDASAFDTKLDFEDSAHMNARGGAKLYRAIADGIAGDAKLAAALSETRLAVTGRSTR
jgi:hypothetical protein